MVYRIQQMVTHVGRRALVVLLALAVLSMSAQAGVAQASALAQADQVIAWSSATPTARFRGISDWLVDVGARTPDEVYGPFAGRAYKVGDTEQFYALDFGSYQDPPRKLTATLKLVTDHAYWWFENGTTTDATALEHAGKRFETDIYPLDHRIFGSEWSPGIDADPHIFLLHQKKIGGYAVGVFSPKDECAAAICHFSNQHELLYIGLDFGPVGSPQELTVIAHEFQHLIQYNVNGNQQRWLDEGLAELAEHLNGSDPYLIAGNNLRGILSNANFQLNSWPSFDSTDPAINYAVAYLFCVYMYQRLGLPFIHYLADSPYKGLASVDHALAALNTGITLDQLFGDWTIANYVNNPYVGDGRYYYQSLKLPQHASAIDISPDIQQSDSIHEYSAQYLHLSTPGHYTLTFKGDQTVPVGKARPVSGKWMWWSFNEPRGAARLEREFDLTDAHNAKLNFNAWWDVQQQIDVAHVLVSTDGGKSWTIVNATSTQDCRLGGSCYTEQSPGWSKETIDLSAYDGRKIQVRFEYLTQGGETGQGFFVDDIRLDAAHFKDDVEGGVNGWQAQGFVRVMQNLPQHWIVNVITQGSPTTVMPVLLDTTNSAKLSIDVPDKGMIIVVGATAPFVQGVTATYKLTAASTP